MARYVVHMKGEGPEALAGARFVRDGFSWLALSFGPLWLLAKGAWISALMAFSVQAILAFGLFGLGLPSGFVQLALFLVNLLIALENATIRSWELRLTGHVEAGLVSGDDPDTLEQRFFAEKLAGRAALPVSATPVQATRPVPVIGLFPSPPRGGNA